MSALGAPLTAKEESVLASLQEAYEQLIEAERKNSVSGRQVIAVLEEIAHPATGVGRAFRELNTEIVARDSRNFRNTKRFRETLLRWGRQLNPPETGDFYVDMFCAGGQDRLWIMGIILYYKQLIQSQLESTGFFKGAFGSEKKPTAGALVDRQAVLSVDDVTAIFQEVEVVDVESLCRSDSFREAIKLVPKMLRSFTLAVKVCDVVSVPQEMMGARRGAESDPSAVLGQQLSNRGWMHILFVMMRSAQYMHDIRTVMQRNDTAGTGVAAADSLPSEESIQSMFTSISTILQNVFGDNSSSILTLLSLRFARSACVTYFNSSAVTDTVRQRLAAQAEALQAASPDHLGIPTALTYEQIQTDSLWRYLTVDTPTFIDRKRTFMESGLMDEWLTTVLFRQLYLYRYPDGSDGAPEAGKGFTSIFYDEEERDIIEGNKVKHLFLFYCFVAVLRPLLHQLLIAKPSKKVSQAVADVSSPEADAEAAALEADHAEYVAAARKAIVDVARTADLVDLQASRFYLREWESLEVGPQPRMRCAIGRECFQKAMGVVLGDLMRASVVWMTQPSAVWSQLYDTKASTRTKESLPEEYELVVFRFLLRTESTYHALTDATAGTSGTDNGVVQTLPDSLQACKGEFNAAVRLALNHYYPFNARYALVVPIIDSVHNYIMDQEYRAGGAGSAGPGARPPPRPGMAKKMPPPPPGTKAPPAGSRPAGAAPPARRPLIRLKMTQELYTALRLIDCVDTDTFFKKYSEMLRARFLNCPPPNRVASDEEFDARRTEAEEVANAYMRQTLGDNNDDLRSVRELCATFKRRVETISGIKMVVSTLPWNLWPLSAVDTRVSEPLTSESRVVSTSATLAATPESPLPFPADLSRAMDTYVNQQEGVMTGRQLRWHGSVEGIFTTFEIRYPRDAGRATTIHSTLLLNQLFLAISQYGSQGVPLDTLAARAQRSRAAIDRALKACIERDRLLVVRSDMVSLNYDFERPEANKAGVFTYWPPPTLTCTRINSAEQEKIHNERISAGRIEVVRIMKSLRKSTFKHVEEVAREKLAQRFTLTKRLFKDIINRLVEEKYIARGATEDDLQYLA